MSAQQPAVPAAPVRVTFAQTVFSVLASFFGVQSTRNWARDFTYGNAWAFIGVGLALTAGFVFCMLLAVKLVLRQAGV